jgi:hypothetical protein
MAGLLLTIVTNQIMPIPDLVAHWKLDEVDGERFDSVGNNTLTDNNTVTQSTGIINEAGQFTLANSEYLSIANANCPDLDLGLIDFTITAWVYADSNPVTDAYVLSKATLTTFVYSLWRSIAVNNPFSFSSAGATVVSTTATVTGTWYFVVGWQDVAGDTVNIQVNDGTIDSASILVDNPSGGDFLIGANTAAVVQDYFDGRIDSVSVFKRILTDEEKTRLYNDGNGLDYPF